MFNLSTEYAIHSLKELLRGEGKPRKIDDLARSGNFSSPYLRKIFQKLEKAGIVKTKLGPHGGVTLSRPANKITLEEVIRAVQGEVIRRCHKHPPEWCYGRECRVKKVLKKGEDVLMEFMGKTKLSDVQY